MRAVAPPPIAPPDPLVDRGTRSPRSPCGLHAAARGRLLSEMIALVGAIDLVDLAPAGAVRARPDRRTPARG